MPGDPSISVVIPCYNGARFLAETLRTVFSQTRPPEEILVVDDGSTDDSAAVAERFGSPVRVLRQANRGESAARNRGIEESRGEWIAFLDADDVWAPKKLERQCKAIEPGVDCVHTSFYYFGSTEGKVDVSAVPPEERYRLEHVAVRNPFRISSLLVRRGLAARFPEWTQYAEDLIYFLDLALDANIRLVPEYLTGYRVHAGGQSANPATAVLRYQSIEAWLTRRADRVDRATAERIREGWLLLLVETATLAKYQREWDAYWTIRRFLEAYRSRPAVEPLLAQPIFPRWIYRVKDALDRLRAGRREG